VPPRSVGWFWPRVVRDEGEGNVLLHAERPPPVDADQLIEDDRHLIELPNPEIVPYPDKDLVRLNRHLIRHAPDVSHGRKTRLAAYPTIRSTSRTLRIATPAGFFRALSALFR